MIPCEAPLTAPPDPHRPLVVMHACRPLLPAKELLATLQSRYPCVGEVRGLGLFLGVEMVEDPETREPSERMASFVARRAIDLGVQVRWKTTRLRLVHTGSRGGVSAP